MTTSKPYSYVAYIDEAGDDGLRRVRPIDSHGSSEWLVVSAVVVRASRENEVKDWVSDIRDGLWRYNRATLHFKDLNENKRLFVCDQLAGLNARYFVVCSNKKNMRGYQNPLAEQVPSQCWFYNWMTRLLLERVTDFVAWRSEVDFGEPQKVKIEFSNRGGLSYSQMKAYWRWISYQGENTFLRFGRINWDAIDYELAKVYPHYDRAGLQLADVVASAFFKAVDKYNTGSCDPRFAAKLQPRMARFRDRPANSPSGYGVKLMPSLKGARLLPEQEQIFRYYGYPTQWWAPDSSNPSSR
ncbi:DUF3800 domain-containing protein [Jannaschia sp. Os4]|uniref:DUF3800 domain-containing protein n=1 Tax=Jannaschia sp. Os4 TaxID=2807617 RepID=UPI0019395039|nr:DUF3800 domain-containing protein [Jannaschia sp. Os4]MBM2575259.1 DUF3800 domain-containing protein [Jannaschia sp. Os4]